MTIVLLLLSLGALAVATRQRAISRRPSGVSQPAVSRQPSAVSRQPPAVSSQPINSQPEGGPPGLSLRREPEIRALSSQALANYVATIRLWLEEGARRRAQGSDPDQAGASRLAPAWDPDQAGASRLAPAWATSYRQAQAEVLLRTRTRRSTADLTDDQLSALTAWIATLHQLQMPVDTDERALEYNLTEEIEHRQEAQGDGRQPNGERT